MFRLTIFILLYLASGGMSLATTIAPPKGELQQQAQDFYLQFDGFSPQEVANIEEYLLVYSGYISHHPTQQRHTRSILLYRSSITTAKLSRNLLKTLDQLNMRATMNFADNQFKFTRITLRGEKPKRDITQGW